MVLGILATIGYAVLQAVGIAAVGIGVGTAIMVGVAVVAVVIGVLDARVNFSGD